VRQGGPALHLTEDLRKGSGHDRSPRDRGHFRKILPFGPADRMGIFEPLLGELGG
jgi:hypothetical protein